jgi:hypothetical protein
MNQEVKYPVQEEKIGMEVVPMRPRAPAVFSLVPKDLSEAMSLAKLIAESDLAPKDYRNKPGNVLIAVQMGQEVGLSPMAAIQSIAVINGKPSLYGDVGKAILLSNGFIIEEAGAEEIKAKGFATCKITRPGHPPCIRTFGKDDAIKAKLWGKDGPWTNYPERQMAWRAFWFAARDIGADVLKGLMGAEEIVDLDPKDITPKADAEYQTGTERLRNAVVKAPTLVEVCKAFGEANTPEDILAAQELAKKLTTDEDKQAANAAYKARIAELKKEAGPAVINGETGKVEDEKPKENSKKSGKVELTYAQIAAKLEKATDQDNLDASADLIQYCVGGADQVEDLNKLYKRRRDEFREGGGK